MISTLRRLALVTVLAASAAVAQTSGEPPIIAKARAYVGSEAALTGLKSVRFTGFLLTAEAGDPQKQVRTPLEIIFQKPDQQRITATTDKEIETTGLDGYEGWQRREDPANPANWRQFLLGVEQIKRLRANTWENLAYFRGIESQGGKVEDKGTQKIGDINCQKIAFIHTPNVIFYRYFDLATGRLVLTETESGGTIREEGEMIVEGIRFPKSIITTTKLPNGSAQTVTVAFDKVEVNQEFPGSAFHVPMPAPAKR